MNRLGIYIHWPYCISKCPYCDFNSHTIELIIITGMIVGSLPFVHYLAITRGGWENLIRDSQVKWFLIIMMIAISFICFDLLREGNNLSDAIRLSSFNTISIF